MLRERVVLGLITTFPMDGMCGQYLTVLDDTGRQAADGAKPWPQGLNIQARAPLYQKLIPAGWNGCLESRVQRCDDV